MIKIPARIRYALRTLVELAKNERVVVPLSLIEKNQMISAKFAKQILQPLERAHVVSSRRGVKGGYRLNKDPAKIHLIDIFRCFDEEFTVSPCLSADLECGRAADCEARPIWEELSLQITDFFTDRSLADLLPPK